MENYQIEARKIARQYKYCPKIAAEINGKVLYLTEGEVRALQIIAKEKAEESDEAFEQFCKDVIIYSNAHKKSSKHTMIFRKDGNFENDFECGFFSATSYMALEIL